jgi:hypothetical protein
MDFNLETFQKLLNNIQNNDDQNNIQNNDDQNNIQNNETIRILISINNNNFIKTGISKFNVLDIFNDKLNKITQNKIRETTVFTRDMYYSQIRDNKVIYTEDYKLLNLFSKNNYNIYLTKYIFTPQDILSFPKLHKYHYSEQITKNIIKIDDFNLITENNKLFIEFNKTVLNTNFINKLFEMISLFISS